MQSIVFAIMFANFDQKEFRNNCITNPFPIYCIKPTFLAGVGAAQEDATEGGCITGHLIDVLSRSNKYGAVFWGRDVGVVGSNGSEYRWSSCGVPVTCDNV